MAPTAQDFVTTSHNEYQWPYSRPLVSKACEPPSPSTTPPPKRPPVPAYCHCDSHLYSPQMEQFKQLLVKEEKLCADYFQLREKIAHLSNEILDHPCDDDDTKLKSIYQISYTKKGYPVIDFKTIRATIEAPAPPVKVHRLGQLRDYKDPTSFSHIHSPTVRPAVEPASEAHTGVSPESLMIYFKEYPGRTEYMDTYSKNAKASWRAMQRYKEPLPSARRREDDKCL